MIRMLTAFTDEVDEREFAVQSILEQLNCEKSMLRNSVAMLFCHPECIDTGVMKAVCDALPCDVVGCTTLASGTAGKAGVLGLSVALLTSDDAHFSATMSGPLTSDPGANVLGAFTRACAGRPGKPALAIAFAPLMVDIGGEVIADALFKAVGDIPVFGTTACDHTAVYDQSYTILNGKAEKTAACLLLVYGDIRPRFVYKIISDRKIQKQKAIITGSNGSLLREVNGIPLMQYLETLGISKNNGIENIGVVPFIVDYNDGNPPVARAMYTVTPEGYAVCGGRMPEGSTLAIGRLDMEDVLETAETATREVMGADVPDVLLLFPCMSRNLVLGSEFKAELDAFERTVGGRVPYLAVYSGGEKCPALTNDGRLVNCFHNFTVAACAF